MYNGDMLWTLCPSSEAPNPMDLFASSDGKRKGRDKFRNKQLLTNYIEHNAAWEINAFSVI